MILTQQQLHDALVERHGTEIQKKLDGATGGSAASVRAISQSETPGTEVAAGTVVRVQFSDSSVTD